MKRTKNKLYFEPHERGKFFRAIRLYEKLKGQDEQDTYEGIQHEKDHINKLIELGHEDKISGYEIGIKKRNSIRLSRTRPFIRKTEEIFIKYSVNHLQLENWEQFKVSMAPKEPSLPDLLDAFGYLRVSQAERDLEKRGNYSLIDLKSKLLETVVQ